ncbi:MAG: hypothetical protein IVW57_03705, partial [Ktedonobacterales bacterium]|nr:hypothetical protein [Ktedonobacterales bacterium]
MLYTHKLLAELERKREVLSGYQRRHGQQLDAYRAALRSLGARFADAATLAAAQEAPHAHAGSRRAPTGA